MQYLEQRLIENNYKFFCKGIYKDENFYEMPSFYKLNAVKVQIKKNFLNNLLNMFVPMVLKPIFESEYEIIYEAGTNVYLYVEFVVNSHIIVPEVLLKDFQSSNTYLYYIDTKIDKIKRGSVRKFNTQFGYYSLRFEKFLSNNYETRIGNIKKKLNDFVFKKEQTVELENLFNDIKRFLNMSFFRNPRFIDEINNEAISSNIIFKGYNSESVALFSNDYGSNLLNGMNIFLIINRTGEGLVLSGEIFSNFSLNNDVHGMILPLHPSYGFAIVPTEYYNEQIKKYTDKCYMAITDIKVLHTINKRIYKDCKKVGANVIGHKEDLERILSL